MSTHATAEALSAYIDRELPAAEAKQVEEHLAVCASCQERFTGMGKVVAGLKHLERMAPPSALGQAVTRRVALEGHQQSLLDRLEGNLGGFERQSSLLGLFGLIVAFAVIILMFAQALEKDSLIPVIFTNEPPPASQELAGRVLHREDGVWVEKGVAAAESRTVLVGSADWTALVAGHPELAEMAEIDAPVVLLIDGETVRLEVPAEREGTGSKPSS